MTMCRRWMCETGPSEDSTRYKNRDGERLHWRYLGRAVRRDWYSWGSWSKGTICKIVRRWPPAPPALLLAGCQFPSVFTDIWCPFIDLTIFTLEGILHNIQNTEIIQFSVILPFKRLESEFERRLLCSPKLLLFDHTNGKYGPTLY